LVRAVSRAAAIILTDDPRSAARPTRGRSIGGYVRGMALAYRTEAKRSSALAVVVAFLAVLLGVSQLAPRGEGAAASTDSDAPTALLHRDVARMRAAAAPVAHKTLTGTPRVMAETTRFLERKRTLLNSSHVSSSYAV